MELDRARLFVFTDCLEPVDPSPCDRDPLGVGLRDVPDFDFKVSRWVWGGLGIGDRGP